MISTLPALQGWISGPLDSFLSRRKRLKPEHCHGYWSIDTNKKGRQQHRKQRER